MSGYEFGPTGSSDGGRVSQTAFQQGAVCSGSYALPGVFGAQSAFQQGGVYSGSYALPGVFDAQQSQHGGRAAAIAPPVASAMLPTLESASSAIGTSNTNPMVLDHDVSPLRPPPSIPVSWGGATATAPVVLGQQQSEVATSSTQHAQLGQQLLPQPLYGYGGIGSPFAPGAVVIPPTQAEAGNHPSALLTTTTPIGMVLSSSTFDGGVVGGEAVASVPQQQPPPSYSNTGGAAVPPPALDTTAFTFGGGGGGGVSGVDKLAVPVVLAGFDSRALQQQQQPAPVYTVQPFTELIPSTFGVEQQQQIRSVLQQQQQQPGMVVATAPPPVGVTATTAPSPAPLFLQLNPLYPGLRTLWETPPVYVVEDFFTGLECDALIALAGNYMIASPVVGAGAGEVSESRTSSSCFLAREDLPTVCRKVMALTGKPLEHLELPQVGRYYTSQKYANHWDAFDLNTEDGRRFAQNGGQRVCTVLVYLNDVASGGCTSFPQLGMKVQPKKGMAVVFFPATLDGTLDSRLLHAAEPAIDTKWVSQIWVRQGAYHGTPTARIPAI